jgi:hypothetical protein
MDIKKALTIGAIVAMVYTSGETINHWNRAIDSYHLHRENPEEAQKEAQKEVNIMTYYAYGCAVSTWIFAGLFGNYIRRRDEKLKAEDPSTPIE